MESKTILITGASRGLGLALAQALAKEGYSLILDARGKESLDSVAKELSTYTKVIAIAGDVSESKHQAELANAAKEFGTVDVLINNASILGLSPQANLLDYPLDVLEDVFRVNLLAPLAILQAVRPYLSANAKILNITSDAGKEAYPTWGGYGSSKAALEHLSAVLAVENPSWQVYWIDPGDMRTQMHQEAFPDEDISDRELPEASIPALLKLIQENYPSGRYKVQSRPAPEADL